MKEDKFIKPETVTTDHAVLGSVITKIRESIGFKQSELADKIGVNQSTWSRIEKGETSLSAFQLYAVSKHLDISIDELFLRYNDIREKISSTSGIKVVTNEEYKKMVPNITGGVAKHGTTSSLETALLNIIGRSSNNPEKCTLPVFGSVLGAIVGGLFAIGGPIGIPIIVGTAIATSHMAAKKNKGDDGAPTITKDRESTLEKWEKLTSYLSNNGSAEIILNDDKIEGIVESVDQERPYKIDLQTHSIRQRAKIAGYDVDVDPQNKEVKIFTKIKLND